MGDCLLHESPTGLVKSRDLLGKYLLCPSYVKKNELLRARPH